MECSPRDFSLERPEDPSIGREVEPRYSQRKMIDRIETQEGDDLDNIREFSRSGGTIRDVTGDLFLVEVDGGSFLVPKVCCRFC